MQLASDASSAHASDELDEEDAVEGVEEWPVEAQEPGLPDGFEVIPEFPALAWNPRARNIRIIESGEGHRFIGRLAVQPLSVQVQCRQGHGACARWINLAQVPSRLALVDWLWRGRGVDTRDAHRAMFDAVMNEYRDG
eukprot:10950954-Karenia_brevis.AAC.1